MLTELTQGVFRVVSYSSMNIVDLDVLKQTTLYKYRQLTITMLTIDQQPITL